MNFTKAIKKVAQGNGQVVAKLQDPYSPFVYTLKRDLNDPNQICLFEADRELWCRLCVDLISSNKWKLIKVAENN